MQLFSQKRQDNLSLIGLISTLSFCLTSIALAEINTSVLFQPLPESEQPESTESAASRKNIQCFQDLLGFQQQESFSDDSKLIPIVPNGNFALTVSERPSFWIYLPQTSAQQVILNIKEEGVNYHWQQSVQLTGKAGMMNIPLSDDAPVLEIGKNYQWAIILVCGEQVSPNDPIVSAWIRRIDEVEAGSALERRSTLEQSEISHNSSLTSYTELQKAADYARQGIWYDALDILAAQRTSVKNWHDIWVKYLQSGGLEEIANKPIINWE